MIRGSRATRVTIESLRFESDRRIPDSSRIKGFHRIASWYLIPPFWDLFNGPHLNPVTINPVIRMSRLGPFFCLVAHDCGYPLSRYTCRATRVAADFLDFKAFCRCSTGVALHPPKNFGVAPPPPPVPGGVAPKFGSEKVSRYTGVSQLQLRVSRYTVQLSFSVRGIPRLCPSNSEPAACNPCFEARNGRPRKHPGTTPGRSNSPKTDIRPTGFNMTGFRCPGFKP